MSVTERRASLTWRGIPETQEDGSILIVWHSKGGTFDYTIRPRPCFGRPEGPLHEVYLSKALLATYLGLDGAKRRVKREERKLALPSLSICACVSCQVSYWGPTPTGHCNRCLLFVVEKGCRVEVEGKTVTYSAPGDHG
jgi:hypothetical protein